MPRITRSTASILGRSCRRLLAPLLLALLVCAGCTSGRRVTIPDWQESIIDYVNDEGEGQPTILRDVTIKGGRRGFAVLGHPHPEKAQDVVGLLLAHRAVAGRPTFIYLVAQVTRQQVRDVRLALLSEQDGQLRWHVGPDDDAARDTYLDWRTAQWQRLYPDRDDPPLSYAGFPLDQDAFDVTQAQGAITAEHLPSGARWTIALPATRPAAAAANANPPHVVSSAPRTNLRRIVSPAAQRSPCSRQMK